MSSLDLAGMKRGRYRFKGVDHEGTPINKVEWLIGYDESSGYLEFGDGTKILIDDVLFKKAAEWFDGGLDSSQKQGELMNILGNDEDLMKQSQMIKQERESIKEPYPNIKMGSVEPTPEPTPEPTSNIEVQTGMKMAVQEPLYTSTEQLILGITNHLVDTGYEHPTKVGAFDIVLPVDVIKLSNSVKHLSDDKETIAKMVLQNEDIKKVVENTSISIIKGFIQDSID